MDPKEEESFNKFRRLELVDSQQQKTLRDFVQEKISNKRTEFNDNFSNAIEIEVYILNLFYYFNFSIGSRDGFRSG